MSGGGVGVPNAAETQRRVLRLPFTRSPFIRKRKTGKRKTEKRETHNAGLALEVRT
jgi:hypothetical protein